MMLQRSHRMRMRGTYGPFVGKGLTLHGQGLTLHGGGLYLHGAQGAGVFDSIKRFFAGTPKKVAKALFNAGKKQGKKVFFEDILPGAKSYAKNQIDSGIDSLNSKFTEKTGVKGLSDASLALVKGKAGEKLDSASKAVFGQGMSVGPLELNQKQIQQHMKVAQQNARNPYELPQKVAMDKHSYNILDGIVLASKMKKKQKKRMMAGKGLITM